MMAYYKDQSLIHYYFWFISITSSSTYLHVAEIEIVMMYDPHKLHNWSQQLLMQFNHKKLKWYFLETP